MAKDVQQPVEKTPKSPSTGALIAKVAFGALFIVYGFFPTEGISSGLEYIITSIVIGTSLIAWGVMSYQKQKKAWEAYQEESRIASLNVVKTCKVCGAKSKGSVCEYCGSPLD